MLDTPLNHFKDPQSAAADGEQVSNEVKAGFMYLANDTSGDQVILIEDEEPPAAIAEFRAPSALASCKRNA